MIDFVSLSAFVAGYLLCLVIPGPNMMALAAVALRGWRYAVPVILGIAAGASILCQVSFGLASAALTNMPKIDEFGRVFSAALMVFIGMMLLQSDPFGAKPAANRRTDRTLFAVGFATAVSNPISIAFFAAQFLGPLRNAGPTTLTAAMLSVPLLAVLRSSLLAALFSRPSVQARIVANALVARRVIAVLFFLIAAFKVIPHDPALLAHFASYRPKLLIELCGFGAGTMTLVAFFCSSMASLRVAAIGANVLFMAYAIGNDLFPILLLHALLLPVNVARLLAMRRRRAQIVDVAQWPAPAPPVPPWHLDYQVPSRAAPMAAIAPAANKV